MKMVDVLPENAVVARLKDVAQESMGRVMINAPVTYYTKCGQMYRGPEQTGVGMNLPIFIRDVQAGRVYIIKPEQHEY